jgi:hypothetical protein
MRGLSSPFLSRWARSASRRRSGSTDEEDGPPVFRLDHGRRGDGDERAAGTHQRGRAVQDLAADHVEDHVDLSGIRQVAGLQVQEGIRAETEYGVPVSGWKSSSQDLAS